MSEIAVLPSVATQFDESQYEFALNAEELAALPEKLRNQFIDSLTDEQANYMFNAWGFRARRKQYPPSGNWRYWLVLAGRGWGKTETIVQWAHLQAKEMPGKQGTIVAATAADARDILVEGVSGFMNAIPDDEKPHYSPTKNLLTWNNGSRALIRSADEPDRMRGLQHAWAIADELASWRRPAALTHLKLGLRVGVNPRIAIATTPKPVKHLRDLLKDKSTFVTSGSTYENRANLAEAFFQEVITAYEGSRLGEQELEGKMLDDQVGALWTAELIEAHRHPDDTPLPDMQRIVVSVDPAVTSGEASNHTGIIVMGKGVDGRGYLLDDRSLRGTPLEWALEVVQCYREYQADMVVVETNQGGDLIASNIHTVDPTIPVKGVHAKRGKVLRAEPVVTLYEQGRISHYGTFGMLESLMTEWMQGMDSPDALDALVQACWELFLGESDQPPTFKQGKATFGQRRQESGHQWTVPR